VSKVPKSPPIEKYLNKLFLLFYAYFYYVGGSVFTNCFW